MKKTVYWLLGVITLLVIQIALSVVGLKLSHGLSAREMPTHFESWVAQRARQIAVPSGVRERANPVPKTTEALAEARAHWADHCATCHGNDGSGETPMGRHMYPPAPDMRKWPTQQLTDGEVFYIIQNGIRFTGMPAWGDGSGHDDEASWKLVHFIRHLPDVTMQERMRMEKLNPKSRDEWKEEEEEEKFLRGEGTNELHQQATHHH